MVFEETILIKNSDIDYTESVDQCSNNTVKTNVVENWKLKRKKPLKNTKGTLESTMGLIVRK